MANIKSAKKRILVNQAKTEENKRLKTNLKTVLKKAEVAIETNATVDYRRRPVLPGSANAPKAF